MNPRQIVVIGCMTTFAVVLAGCTSTPTREARVPAPTTPGKPGYYKDDGPADVTPADLDGVADAVPQREPLHRFANRPYTVFGREYVPATQLRPYRERGVASWYGRKFHGQKTATGETYDMFAMTAAHPTLPLPSYARVTNPANGRSVVVRVNDRGPFLNDRVMDLSYAAAHRLGIAQRGSGEVEVEAILLDDVLTAGAPALPPVVPRPVVVASNVVPATPVGDVASPRSDTPSIAAAETVPVTPSGAGYVVQLGAFASLPNAQTFRAHIANQLYPLGVEAQIRQVNGLFRVFVGPYTARAEAKVQADRLRAELGLPSMVAVH